MPDVHNPALGDVIGRMTIGHDEIFGPVAAISPVKTLDEAIALMKSHLKAHGRDAFEFYTDKKVTISRRF
jgi:acyl-CoA reductase-like NAD-dependent aldehyde dehydrogenase